ncbi:MAG TPA: non-canonical purine NTP pyrophosphatase, partial [Methanocorpusculum sp.]|nr:non-canonical purine NTP pyrophosphatase [Methanocorpusculum sp.]
FGYDPIFSVGEKTLAEMTLSEKNLVSHRARALEEFRKWYVSNR